MVQLILAQDSKLGIYVLAASFVMVAVLLIGLILLQKNRGSGLSGAFGGVGGHSAFGTKTGDFLTWVTVGLVVVFLSLAIAGNFLFEPKSLADEAPTISADPDDSGATPSDTTDPAPGG